MQTQEPVTINSLPGSGILRILDSVSFLALDHRYNFISLWECLSTPNVQLSTYNVVKEVGQI